MHDADPPRILLGNLEPIMLVGLLQVLAEAGIDVVGHRQAEADLLGDAERLQPDVVVLDLDTERDASLADGVRLAAPNAKVIFWARDETLMEVLDPRAVDVRVVTAPDGIRSELTNCK